MSARIALGTWATVLGVSLAASSALAGPAVGQFELKDLDAEPGALQFQSQNAYSWGQPRRRMRADPADPSKTLYDENTAIRARSALELEMGYTRHLKGRIGIEFERERIDDPSSPHDANAFNDFKLSEIGAEVIGVLVRREGDGAGLGVVVEVEHPFEKGEANSLSFGPIIEIAKGPWLFAVVPTLVRSFGGDKDDNGQRDDKWDFAYAAQLAYEFSDTWTLALEAYGTVDRIFGSGTPSEESVLFGDFDQHRLGPILYYNFDVEERGAEVSIGAGILAGLNSNTPDATLKLSLEVDF